MSSCEGIFGSCSGFDSDSGNIFKKWLSAEKYSRAESSFGGLRDEVKVVAKNDQEHALSLMTDRVLKDFIEYSNYSNLHISERRQSLESSGLRRPTETNTQDINVINVSDMPKTMKPLLPWVRIKPRTQRKNPRMKEQAGADPSAGMPTEFQTRVKELQGRDVKMLMEKKIPLTDLNRDTNRLLISRTQPIEEVLTKEEQAQTVKKTQQGRFEGLQVNLIEPSLKESKILLKKWRSGRDLSYVLSSEWISVAERNGLAVDDVIQLWSFRVGGRLWFALTKLND